MRVSKYFGQTVGSPPTHSKQLVNAIFTRQSVCLRFGMVSPLFEAETRQIG